MTPEQQARQRIDEQLVKCGWDVQDHADMNISAGPGVAVREFPLTTGTADYMLYADCRALGVIVGHNLGAKISDRSGNAGSNGRISCEA